MAADKIFLISAIILAWTYLLYPAMVLTLAAVRKRRKTVTDKQQPGSTASLPAVSVIMSVFNEEKVISEKIRSMLISDYPPELTEIIIGSDASTDGTDEIVMKFAASDNRIKYHRKSLRTGKAAMLNELVAIANGSILIITDANVFFSGATIRLMAAEFASLRTGLCDATVVPSASPGHGITRQENLYSRFETTLKRAEGDLWGAMPGPYGGCYAVRRKLFPRPS